MYCFQWTGECAEGWSASATVLDECEQKESLSHFQSANPSLQFTHHRKIKKPADIFFPDSGSSIIRLVISPRLCDITAVEKAIHIMTDRDQVGFKGHVKNWSVHFYQLPVGIRNGCSEVLQPLCTIKGKIGWPRMYSRRGKNEHVVCFIILVALLVCDQLYAHPHRCTGDNSVNGRLVASPVCIGGNGRLEAKLTTLTHNPQQNAPHQK